MTELLDAKVKGRCKWFNAGKGYGFLVPEAKGSHDVFVHYSQIQGDTQYKTLKEGDIVEFKLVKGEKGLQAQEVTVLVPEVKE